LFSELIWSQEEHRNQGAWTFVQPRLKNFLGYPNIRYAGRSVHSAPAVGIGKIHQQEIQDLIKQTFNV